MLRNLWRKLIDRLKTAWADLELKWAAIDFEEDRISIGEFQDAVHQYEERMESIRASRPNSDR